MRNFPDAARGSVPSSPRFGIGIDPPRLARGGGRLVAMPIAGALRMALCAMALAAFAASPPAAQAKGKSATKRINDARTGFGEALGSNATTLERVSVYGVRGPEFVNPSLASYNYTRGGPGAESGGGAGAGAIGNLGAREQPTSDKRGDCGATSSNPIVLFSGNKIEPELDFSGAGEMALFLQRTYNHFWSATGLFGDRWLSNFDYTLAPSTAGGQSLLWAQRPDGRRIKFVYDATSARWNEDKPVPVAYVVRQGDGGYLLRNEGNGQERYSADGYIQELHSEAGVRWSFAYDGKYLRQVTHSSGRSVQFGWSGNQLTQVTAPNGSVYRYTYAANALGNQRNRLSSTTLPGPPAIRIDYHYEDSRFAGGLTGKSFNGVRYSSFAYDEQGRAISSQHAGGVERSSFAYTVEASQMVSPPPVPPRPGGQGGGGDEGWCDYRPGQGQVCYEPRLSADGDMAAASQASAGLSAPVDAASAKPVPTRLKVVETNPLGKQTVHRYEDDRKVSVEGAASPHCAASYREQSYDANGYPDIVADFAGHLTNFDYDAAGRMHKRVEAAGSPVERTTTYAWDETTGRLLRETLVGDRETTYAYTATGRPQTVTVKNLSANGVAGQTLTTSYSYTVHGNGLIATATIDGPIAGSGDAQTSTYSASGDLIQVRNGLGHTTTYENYDALGAPGRITDENGAVIELSYDAQGRIVLERSLRGGQHADTRYVYGASGLLDARIAPDGVETRYVYDAARRLVEEYQREADGLYARRRYTLNAMSQPIRIDTQRVDREPGSVP